MPTVRLAVTPIAVRLICIMCSLSSGVQTDKTCPGIDISARTPYVNAENIDNFSGCTTINGLLYFGQETFVNSYPSANQSAQQGGQTNAVTVDKLNDVFANVVEIVDYLKIISVDFETLRSLSFLRNLRTIRGRHTAGGNSNNASLWVTGTRLEYLGLVSLSHIQRGNVIIRDNSQLCFVETIDWSMLMKSGQTIVSNNVCAKYQESEPTCRRRCKDGCWGPGDDQCLWCRQFQNDVTRRCLASCDEDPGLYQESNKLCRPCDEQCLGKCTGEGPSKCDACKNVKDGSNCTVECPPSKYRDNTTATTDTCQPCQPECQECVGPRHANCSRCAYWKVSVNDMLERGGRKLLANYNVSETDTFFCVSTCPSVLPYRVVDYSSGYPDIVCSAVPLSTGGIVAVSLGVIGTVVAVAVVVVIVVRCRRRRKATEVRKIDLRADVGGFTEETEVLTSNNVKPDMSSLRLCKASELQRGEMIGSGAFGKVYKGIFMPERENVKVPVAIKELSASSKPGSSSELLEEARVMATVVHPCCIRIMAVCMTRQMMLVTPLMPFGSMLDYIRRNRANAGSRVMLTWARQIAEGMEYLENVDIVHRDLAARNVLVHNAHQVKITDFGLSKILDDNASNFESTGGNLPIKWLALESIQQKLFTHKSDVWSYGVTLWELFTYGERPFSEIKAIDFADALERGDRLPQPAICSINVYTLLLKCWTIDVDSRPSFAELRREFTKMSNDPQRYLSIPKDDQMQLPGETVEAYEMLQRTGDLSNELRLIDAADYYEQIDEDKVGGYETLQQSDADRSDVCKSYIDVLESPGIKPELRPPYNSDTAVRFKNASGDEAGRQQAEPTIGEDGYLVARNPRQSYDRGYIPIVCDPYVNPSTTIQP